MECHFGSLSMYQSRVVCNGDRGGPEDDDGKEGRAKTGGGVVKKDGEGRGGMGWRTASFGKREGKSDCDDVDDADDAGGAG